jgi:hypothetical protein
LVTQFYNDNAKELVQLAPLIMSQSQRFFAEANIALPRLSLDNSSVNDLFEAMVMQRGWLKEMQ